MSNTYDPKELLKLLNKAWEYLEEYPKYSEFNKILKIKNKALLRKDKDLEHFTVTSHEDLSVISIIVSLTELGCGEKFAAIVSDDGLIIGWQIYKESIYTHPVESQTACLKGFASNRKVKVLEKEVTSSIAYVK